MAHRGRLNVLANTLKKSYEFIFAESPTTTCPKQWVVTATSSITLDTKTSSKLKRAIRWRSGSHPSFSPRRRQPRRPGQSPARQRILKDHERKNVLPVLIHGDAAFADRAWSRKSQLFSTARISNRRIAARIVNSQIGFTTTPTEVDLPPLHRHRQDDRSPYFSC